MMTNTEDNNNNTQQQPSQQQPSKKHKVYLEMEDPTQKRNGIFVIPSVTQTGKIYPFPKEANETKEQYEKRANEDPNVVGRVVAVSLDPRQNVVVVELRT